MNEQQRTLVFVALAVVVALFCGGEYALSGRGTVDPGPTGPLTDLASADQATRVEVTTYDEAQARRKQLSVGRKAGSWVVESHDGYPADAKQQLQDAAAALIGLTPLGIASDKKNEHELYGVVEPTKEITAGAKGVGTLVSVQDGKGADVARLIIGKAVDGAEGQRFVRKPSQDVVFVCKIDPAKFPADFDKWIEQDLLQLNALDVSQITLKDYSIINTPQGRPQLFPRMEAGLRWNSEQGKWQLDSMLRTLDGGKQAAEELSETEELNTQKLDELKTALDELKIVDVVRKPAGISPDLTIDEKMLNNDEAMASLQELGYYVSQSATGFDLKSANGEVLVELKDGVQYVLRFGAAQATTEGAEQGSLNRYLLVTARVSPSLDKPPTLEPEPQDVPVSPAPGAKPGEEKEGGGGQEPAAAQPEAGAKPDAAKQDAADPAKPSATPPAVDPKQLELDRIRKENKRRLDEYNDKKNKAKGRVVELNARFADWYYVISDEVYKKVHLSRAEIVKESATARDTGFGVDAFRKLQSEGVKPPAPAAPAGGGFPGGGFPGGPGGFPGGFPGQP